MSFSMQMGRSTLCVFHVLVYPSNLDSVCKKLTTRGRYFSYALFALCRTKCSGNPTKWGRYRENRTSGEFPKLESLILISERPLYYPDEEWRFSRTRLVVSDYVSSISRFDVSVIRKYSQSPWKVSSPTLGNISALLKLSSLEIPLLKPKRSTTPNFNDIYVT